MLLAPRQARPRLTAHPLAYLLLLLMLLAPLPQQFPPPAPSLSSPSLPSPARAEELAVQLGRLPLAFEPAAAQAGPAARFQARALGGTLLFGPAGLRLARRDSAELGLRFVGADPAAALEMADPLPGRVSRFLGSDPAGWQRDLPTSAALVYRGLYPGVDLRYDGAAGRLKGTYLLAPGADPARIRWRYDGAGGVRLDPSGDVQITLAPSEPGGQPRTLAERAPVAWQEVGGARVPVEAAFALASDGGVGFRLGRYDPRLPLTIDPTLEFSTFDPRLKFSTLLGGAVEESIRDVAFDQQGNIYAVGGSTSTDFPLHHPLYPASGGGSDVVLLKLSPSGTTLLFSTYLGGSGDEEASTVLVDQRGVVVLGTIEQPAAGEPFFPTEPAMKPNAGKEMFVTRLNASGTKLEWSRYLGGSDNDWFRDALLDAKGQVTLIGTTRSVDFPAGSGPVFQTTMPPSGHSAVIVRLSADGQQIIFRTFLGGTAASEGSGIALAPDGAPDSALVVVGATHGGFQIKNGLTGPNGSSGFQGGDVDGFVAKLTPGAIDLVFSTYLGGNGKEGVSDLALDGAGTIYVTGSTRSGNFPSDRTFQHPDGFVVKLSADGQQQRFGALVGGFEEEDFGRIELDAQGNIYLLGTSYSSDVKLFNPVMPAPSSLDGKYWPNLLLVKLSNDGQTTQISTLLGGPGAELGHALAVSPAGRVALGGVAFSSDKLPLRNALQTSMSGNNEGLLMIIDTAPQLELTVASAPTALPDCPADPCPAVSFTWTLSAPHRLDATVAVTLPEGLELVGGELGFSGTVQRGSLQRISYQARARKGLLPGSLLTTVASAATPGAPPVRRSLTLALPSKEETSPLVMIYASGDNNLSDAMLLMANQAERGVPQPEHASTSGVVGLLLLDGPGPDDAYLYRLRPPAPGQPDCFVRPRDPSCGGRYTLGETYWKWPDNLASPDTLTDFLVSAQRAFPKAARRVLSLVGHGGGWSPNVLDGQPSRHGGQPSGDPGGMLWDDNPGASLSTAELARALRDSQREIGGPLDLLYLDACLMSQIEVAYELRGSAEYLLASPNWKWAAFPYEQHLKTAAAGDGLAIGRAWLANEQEALKHYQDEPYTYTLLDLGQIEALGAAVDILARQLMIQTPGQIREALFGVERYDSDQDGAIDKDSKDSKDSAIDLGSLTTKLTTVFAGKPDIVSAAEQVRQALDGAVVQFNASSGHPWLFPKTKLWSWEESAGLSIYLPLGQNDWRRRYYRTLAFGQNSAWASLIDHIWNPAPPPGDPLCPGTCEPPPGPQLRPGAPRWRWVFLPLVRR